MRDLAGIAEINGPRAAELQATRAQTVKDATERSADSRTTQIAHGARAELRQAVNGSTFVHPHGHRTLADRPKVPPIEERIQPGIDERDVFFEFWLRKNAEQAALGNPELGYRAARLAFVGGPTPEDAISYVGDHGQGLRAVPSIDPSLPSRGYYGQFVTVDHIDGTKWHTVLNLNELPICYTTVEAALAAAALIQKEYK